MSDTSEIKTHEIPDGIPTNEDFVIQARPVDPRSPFREWTTLQAIHVEVAEMNTTCNVFDRHPISIASLDINGAIEIKARYVAETVKSAAIRPRSLGIPTTIDKTNTITFILERPVNVMLEIINNKWKALHVLANEIDSEAPTGDTENVWYFGPGINNGLAYSKVVDGNLVVPSDTTVYLAGGVFLTAKLNFIDVSNAGVSGHGFIYQGPNGGAILMERTRNIKVHKVTSLGATGFSLTTGNAQGVHINGYRSFSSCGNGDGVDFFCSKDILVENCFLRNSDDTVAIYGHRWDYAGDTSNITIRNCTLLADIAHAINIGTHGNPAKPETMSNIKISNIDILDHFENQLWYQGCIGINAADENLIENVLIEDIRIEKISKGQLLNLRVIQNAMWTTAPGRGIRNNTFKNLDLSIEKSEIVNPSQLLGYNETRNIENITFENLKIGGQYIHDAMQKPRWYMTSDLAPIFINEHVIDVKLCLKK
ncbi:hypothetical protein EAE96_001835 [Botrytis aclada]|nr:hypothetical protein EAE96_001835 [Botrytis aclada]